MSASSAAWSHNQQQIGIGQEARPRAYKPAFRPPMHSAPPPPFYVCFRCGQKGHYISNCPTNSDPTFDKPKLKKSTGIPRAFLKTVEATGDSSGGVLVTPDGSLVVAVSNDKEWQNISALSNRSLINQADIPDDLRCKICTKVLNDPAMCPNCKAVFCEDCIMKTGPQKALSCSSCFASFNAEQLLPAEGIRKRVENFITSSQTKTTPTLPPAANPPGIIPPLGLPPLPFPMMIPFPPFLPPPPLNPNQATVTPPAVEQPPKRHLSRSPSPRRPSRRRSRSPDDRSRRR